MLVFSMHKDKTPTSGDTDMQHAEDVKRSESSTTRSKSTLQLLVKFKPRNPEINQKTRDLRCSHGKQLTNLCTQVVTESFE